MVWWRRVRVRTLVAIAVIAILASSCTLFVARPTGGGGSAPCHEGTWELSGQQVASAITSVFGDLAVTPDNDGMTLILRADDSFEFSGQQSLGVIGQTPYGLLDGTVSVDASVNGTYTSSSGSLTFVPSSITGEGDFSGTVNGMPVSVTSSLAQIGLDDIYGLSGTADTSCTETKLTLDVDDVDWEF